MNRLLKLFLGAILVFVLITTTCFCYADSSPVGVWSYVNDNNGSYIFNTVALYKNNTGLITSYTTDLMCIAKIKWSLNGNTIKYTVTESDKGFSVYKMAITFNPEYKITFKNDVLYCDNIALVRVPIH